MDGIFNVLIGSGTVTAGTEEGLIEIFENNRAVWMSTEVDSDGEMEPRQRIGSVGYALQAGNATNLSHIEPVTTAPPSPTKGDVYTDDTTNKLMVYDGTTWQACW